MLNTTCYDDMGVLGMDPEELNLVMYDRKKQRVLAVELEDFETRAVAKQLYNLKVGMGKKVRPQTFDKYLGSKDCSIGGAAEDGDL